MSASSSFRFGADEALDLADGRLDDPATRLAAQSLQNALADALG